MVCLRSLIFLVDKKAEKLCLFSSFIRALDSICTKVFCKAQSSNDLGQEKKGGFFLVNGFLCSSRDTLEGLLSLSKEGVVAVVVEILWIAFLSPTGMQRNDRQGTRLSSPFLPFFTLVAKGFPIWWLAPCLLRDKKEPFRHYIIQKRVIAHPLHVSQRPSAAVGWKLVLISISNEEVFQSFTC